MFFTSKLVRHIDFKINTGRVSHPILMTIAIITTNRLENMWKCYMRQCWHHILEQGCDRFYFKGILSWI